MSSYYYHYVVLPSLFAGKNLPLLPVARILFSHVWDVLKDVPSFQSEYSVLLRHLLTVPEYRFHMRKRVYSSQYISDLVCHCAIRNMMLLLTLYGFQLIDFVLLYMEKVEASLSENISQPKEEVFRFTLTLQSLLENPPGDISDELREDMVKGFAGIFSHVRLDLHFT